MGRAGKLWWAANRWLQPHFLDGTFLTVAVAATMLAAVESIAAVAQLFTLLPDDDGGGKSGKGASASARDSDAAAAAADPDCGTGATGGTEGTDGVNQ